MTNSKNFKGIQVVLIVISIIGLIFALMGSCGGITNPFKMVCGKTYITIAVIWLVFSIICILELIFKKSIITTLLKILLPIGVIIVMKGFTPLRICMKPHMACHANTSTQYIIAGIVIAITLIQVFLTIKKER